ETTADKLKPIDASAGGLPPRDKTSERSPVFGPAVTPMVAGDLPIKTAVPESQPQAALAQNVAAVGPLLASRPNRGRRLAAGFALVALLLTATALMLRTRAQPRGPSDVAVASNVKETRPDSRATRLGPTAVSRAVGVTGAAQASPPPPPIAAAAASSKSDTAGTNP